MKIELTSTFRDQLRKQIQYISKDKPTAARKFNTLIFQKIRKIPEAPFKNRKSFFFDNENIRDLIVKGYLIVYEILKIENKTVIFGFYKWKREL